MKLNQSRYAFILVSIALAGILLTFAVLRAQSEPVAPDSAAITAAVEGFANALEKGNGAAAMDLLAPDALIMESGSEQTRDEYGQKHLQEDMAMLKAVPMTRANLIVKQEGSAAWATSL